MTEELWPTRKKGKDEGGLAGGGDGRRGDWRTRVTGGRLGGGMGRSWVGAHCTCLV